MCTVWANFNFSPILRGDKSLRIYYFNFRGQTGYFDYARRFGLSQLGLHRIVNEPEDLFAEPEIARPTAWLFRGIPWYEDYFVRLRGSESILRKGFFEMLRPNVAEEASETAAPLVAVHVRRGDFCIARDLTENNYFVKAIDQIRKSAGKTLPVTVFSDAEDDQLIDILQLPNVQRHPNGNDVLDLITMSKARIIVTSLHSTYGYWAGFLSEAAIVLDPRHGDSRIRAERSDLVEGNIADCCEAIEDGRIKIHES